MTAESKSNLILIAGLGNPGKEYDDTRHNAGFAVIDKLLEIMPGKFEEKEAFSSIFWQGRSRGGKLILQKPMTYMNLSGKAVSAIMRKLEISPGELLLIFDDMDLPLGKIRIRKNGSSGGHNGIQSVIDHLGSNAFARLRIGIGRSENHNQVDHVLSTFASDEKELFEKVIGISAEAVKLAMYRGVGTAMNKYNGEIIGEEITEKNQD
jgi:PTH1 family peptidyl-tRNA hydrolase